MVLKRRFTDEELLGLSQEEIQLATKYLRRYKTAGALSDLEAVKVYEMFMLGCSFSEMHSQFPQYDLGRLVLTAAIRKWGIDREKMQHTLRDRVKAKIVKSVIEQVDFLTTMLSVSNTEHLAVMRNYISDPLKNPKPKMTVKSIKEYKDVVETLTKLVQGSVSGNNSRSSAMFDALESTQGKPKIKSKQDLEEIDMDDVVY